MTVQSRLVLRGLVRQLCTRFSANRPLAATDRKTPKLIEPTLLTDPSQRHFCTNDIKRTSSSRTLPGETCTVNDVVQRWGKVLESRGDPEPESAVGLIVAHVMGKKTLYEVNMNADVDEESKGRIQQLCERRLKREPVQYIIGEWDFCDITLEMRPPVLIPRPETEELVELIANDWRQIADADGRTDGHFLDIGCGSGAISLYLLKHCPEIQCVAVDVNEVACDLTQSNASKIGVQDRLSVIQGNIYSDDLVCTLTKAGPFDVIVSNPPYITTEEMRNLDVQVSSYEDHRALHGGIDGFDVVERILNTSRQLLSPANGRLWFEGGLRHPDMIADWIQKNPQSGLTYLNTYLDYTRRPRFSKVGPTRET